MIGWIRAISREAISSAGELGKPTDILFLDLDCDIDEIEVHDDTIGLGLGIVIAVDDWPERRDDPLLEALVSFSLRSG